MTFEQRDELGIEALEVRAHIGQGRTLRAAFELGRLAGQVDRDRAESALQLLERGDLQAAEREVREIWLQVVSTPRGPARPRLVLIRGGAR